MKIKTKCLILLSVAAMLFLWLTFMVLPNKNVITVMKKCPVSELHGLVLAQMSSNHKTSIRGRTSTVQIEKWRNIERANGWDAVEAWMPFAVIIFLVSCVVGTFVGWFLRGCDAEEKYKDQIKAMAKEVELSKTTMAEARKLERNVNEAFQREVKFVERVQRDAASKISAAEDMAAVENELRSEAERKLETERFKHEEEIRKAGARIAELKAKTKKNKDLDWS